MFSIGGCWRTTGKSSHIQAATCPPLTPLTRLRDSSAHWGEYGYRGYAVTALAEGQARYYHDAN